MRKLALCLITLVLSGAALAQNQRYDHLGFWDFAEQWNPAAAATPAEACNTIAQRYVIPGVPPTIVLGQTAPMAWFCRPNTNHVIYIRAKCRPTSRPLSNPPTTWEPQYDENSLQPCFCYPSQYHGGLPMKIDRSTYLCSVTPSCQWYPDNRASGCGKSVDDLMQVVKAPGDPTAIFHTNQTCIARASCDSRCKMGNCKWLDRVIPDFVTPYLQKTGEWLARESECRSPPTYMLGSYLSGRWCAAKMARYHISADLLPAVINSGCGSDADWAEVFEKIQGCTTQTFGNSIEGSAATAPVYLYRQFIRSKCQAARAATGKPIDVEESLRGQACAP